MNANASWDHAPSKLANASWDVRSTATGNESAKTAAAASLLVGKDKTTLMAMLKMAQQNPKLPMKPKSNISGAMSTSALSNMMLRHPDASNLRVRSKASLAENIPEHNPADGSPSMDSTPKKSRKMSGTRLRKETIMSLGIDMKKPITELRGCMKKGEGLNRAATLGNFREISATGPGGRPIKRNVSITFNETVEIKRVPSASSLANNPQELWFQHHEEQEIRKTAKALVKIVDESDVDPSLLDLHGLESHTRFNKKIAQARKYDTWDAVLDAQDVVRVKGVEYNDEVIAAMVRTVSAQSLQDAQARARQYIVTS
jgi:hypothetical protein